MHSSLVKELVVWQINLFFRQIEVDWKQKSISLA